MKNIIQRFCLTTHDLADIEALCERVVMLDEGNIIYDGSLQKLRTTVGVENKYSLNL